MKMISCQYKTKSGVCGATKFICCVLNGRVACWRCYSLIKHGVERTNELAKYDVKYRKA